MTNTPGTLQPTDPRFGLSAVVDALGDLIRSTPPDAHRDPTPCSEFSVSDLLDHIVMVMRRVGAIGGGDHWSSVEQHQLADHSNEFDRAARAAHDAWSDDSKLESEFEVPWGSFPGAPILHTYTAELAIHGWDLATATEQELVLDDELLAGALVAIKMIPAEGRGPELPFDPVVDPGPGAPVLLQMAGWAGRRV